MGSPHSIINWPFPSNMFLVSNCPTVTLFGTIGPEFTKGLWVFLGLERIDGLPPF